MKGYSTSDYCTSGTCTPVVSSSTWDLAVKSLYRVLPKHLERNSPAKKRLSLVKPPSLTSLFTAPIVFVQRNSAGSVEKLFILVQNELIWN